MKTKIFTVFLFSISMFVFSQHKFMKYPEFNKNELSKTKSTIKEDAHAEILYSSISNLIINGELETKVFKRINLYLIMLMREAGLNVSPMIMNTVNRGILNIAFPTIGAPNYVVACLEDNGNYYLYDATSKFSLPNLLPPRAYNYNAILLKDKKAEILQINNFIESKTYLNVDAKLNEDTTFEGNFKDRDTKTFAILAYDEYVDNKQDYEKKYKERYTFNFNNYKSEVLNDNEFQTSFDFNTAGIVTGKQIGRAHV